MATDITTTLAAVGGIVFGGGGAAAIVTGYFKFRTAADKLDLERQHMTAVDVPAADASIAAGANQLLLAQLEAQERRHAAERVELRTEINGLRDTISSMGERLDGMRERLDERDAVILRLTGERDTARLEARDLAEELSDLKATGAAGRRVTDAAGPVPVVVVEPKG